MNIGILGCGWIAGRTAQTLAVMEKSEDICCLAAGSRSLDKAREFAAEHNIPKAYGSYEELARDPGIDLIYIATPHSHHFEHGMLCLEHGKHILVEKAFTVNAKQARALINTAKAKGLLAAEAIWTRYMPARFALDKILASGVIGKPERLTANLGYNSMHKERMYEPALAGGALLDLGVYVINFALAAFGTDIERIEGTADLYSTGTDVRNNITIHFKDGKTAVLYACADEATDRKGMIYGGNGHIEFENINCCEWIRIYIDGARATHFDIPRQITGLEHQLRACKRAIDEAHKMRREASDCPQTIECAEMPHSEIIRVMEIMDGLRGQWGVKYPMEV